MSNRIAFSLSLAILIWLAGCIPQSEPERAAADPATSADRSDVQIIPLRSQADPAHGRVWSLTPAGISLREVATGRSVTMTLAGWHWAGEPFGCPPELALGPKGEAIVTSDVLPQIWRVDPETLDVTVHSLALDADSDRDVGFTAIAYSARHGAYFAVSGAHGTLWRIDPLLRTARKTPFAGEPGLACGSAPLSRSPAA